MRLTLMHNPNAGDVTSSADDLVRALAAAGHDVVYQSMKDRTKKIDRALADPGDLVVAAGGDGTVRKIASRLAGRGVPMAILPLGSGNNIARSLGQIGPRQELIEGWEAGQRLRVDLGVVRGPWGDEHFLESVGVGILARFFALTVEYAQGERGGLTGHRADRQLQILRQAIEAECPRRFRLRFDGHDFEGRFLAVEAMNIRFIGPNVPLAADADPGDGRLDLVMVTEDQREALLDYVRGRLKGHVAMPAVSVRRVRKLQIHPEQGPMHVDGELRMKAGESWQQEVEISLLPHAVEIVVCERAVHIGSRGPDRTPRRAGARKAP